MGGGLSKLNSGRPRLWNQFLQVGGKNVVKFHAGRTVDCFAKNAKKCDFGQEYGKFSFWRLLSDDVIGGVRYRMMTWWLASGPRGMMTWRTARSNGGSGADVVLTQA